MAREQEVVLDFDKVVFGGYDVEQVEEYAAEMEQTIAALKKENAVLTQKLRFLAAKVEEYRAKEAELDKLLAEKSAAAPASAPAESTALHAKEKEELQKANAALSEELERLKQEVSALKGENEALKAEKEELAKAQTVATVQISGDEQLKKVLETAKAAFLAQKERAEKAEKLLARLREEEQAFYYEFLEKSKARIDVLLGEAYVPEAVPEMTLPEVKEEPAAAPSVAEVAEAVKTVLESAPEQAEPAWDEQTQRISSADILKDLHPVEEPPKEGPVSYGEQSYEETLARILQKEASSANLRPGESKVVSLKAPEPMRTAESRRSPSRTRDDWAGQAEAPARRERVAPPKKKKQGLMDFIKESIQRALEDDEDDYEDDLEPFQLDKTYDKKRK